MEINNAIRDYVRMLHEVNGRFIIVASYNAYYVSDGDYELIKLISDLVRLIPAKYHKKSQKYILQNSDGLAPFTELASFKNDIDKLLLEEQSTIKDLFQIRNKYEHGIHNIEVKEIGYSTTQLSDITVKIGNEDYDIKSIDILKILKKLNLIYDKCLKEVLEKYYYSKNKIEVHKYYENLERFDFKSYNQALEVELIDKIGKIFLPFFG